MSDESNEFEAAMSWISVLEKENAVLREALALSLSFAPKGPVPEGPKGNPMFYFTGTYEGDVELQKRIDAARELLK
jgi:hypothetical protein